MVHGLTRLPRYGHLTLFYSCDIYTGDICHLVYFVRDLGLGGGCKSVMGLDLGLGLGLSIVFGYSLSVGN